MCLQIYAVETLDVRKGQLMISKNVNRSINQSLNTLLKSNVTTWSVGGRCRGSQECGSRFVNFACKYHWRWHAVFGSSHNSEIYTIDVHAH